MTKEEISKIFEGIVEPDDYENFNHALELQTRIDESKTQLDEVREITTKAYYKKVKELKSSIIHGISKKHDLKEEFDKLCKKSCKEGIHLKHKYSQKYNNSTINAEYCPICDEFLKITQTCKNGELKNVSVKSFVKIYNSIGYRAFGAYASPGHVNHLLRGPFECYDKDHDLKVIISEFRKMLKETNDTKEKECIKQIVKLGEKLDNVKTKLDNLYALRGKMCANFGHDISESCNIDRTFCQCCGKDLSYYAAMKYYMKAPLHGTVKFNCIKFGLGCSAYDDSLGRIYKMFDDDEELDDDEDSDDDF